MDGSTADKTDGIDNTGGLSRVDELLESAASSIDRADYKNAIADFEQVVEITHNIFGDRAELLEVKSKIKEIQELLSSM